MSTDDTRARLLHAAKDCFLKLGYRASVDKIARRAGVAKQTLYHHFPAKEALFEAAGTELARSVLVSLEAGPRDIRSALIRFATAYRQRVLGAEGLAMFRMFTGEIPRFPRLAKAVYLGGAGETGRRLAAFLDAAMASGALRRDNPEFAADMLLGMLAGPERLRLLYGVSKPTGGERAKIARIVECFLCAFLPKGARMRGDQE